MIFLIKCFEADFLWKVSLIMAPEKLYHEILLRNKHDNGVIPLKQTRSFLNYGTQTYH